MKPVNTNVSGSRSTIICVDDEKMLLNILHDQLTEWLGANYTIEKALGGEEALMLLDDLLSDGIDVSVVITDYVMPYMKGDELLEHVKKRDPHIKKIMLTGYSSLDGIVAAINRAGLYRYITKPWDNKDLLLTIIEAIKSYEQEKKSAALLKDFEVLYRRYERLYTNLQTDYDKLNETLANAADMRDRRMEGHSRRVAEYSAVIGEAYGMIDMDLKYLVNAANLHEIGNIGMSDAEIHKYNGIQLYNHGDHVMKLNKITEDIISRLDESGRVLDAIKYHWERYDGAGVYGLRGNKIPLDARIIGIANYYDLINGNTVKGQKLPVEVSVQIMEKTKESIFDPVLTNIFIRLLTSGQIRR